ncbi:MAG: glycosyltransferase [Verrucomicrobia bacterium]|nr:glycosyltransferase [Verrucomicrobiota bacterium]
MNPEISVVVPLYNEAHNVQPLAQRIFEALREEKRPIELILVDDRSTDETWQEILKARRADARIRAVRHAKQSGQSAALWTGFQASRGEVVATLDGDLQNDPAQLTSCDMVVGVRVGRKDTMVRRLSSLIARAARRAVLGIDFRDSGCNLRVFKRSVLKLLPAFDGLHRFVPILAHGGGAVVKEMPVIHHARVAGLSKYGILNRLGRGISGLVLVRKCLKGQVPATRPIETAWEEYRD